MHWNTYVLVIYIALVAMLVSCYLLSPAAELHGTKRTIKLC
jgi:hypothetical protein